jgi:hypothetical protein
MEVHLRTADLPWRRPMAERRPGAAETQSDEHLAESGLDGAPGDPFEAWDRHPIDEADENIGYQRLAWFAAPFGDVAVALLALAAVVNGLRRVGRAFIRLLLR